MPSDTLNILFVGDVVGSPGRKILAALLPLLRGRHDLHAVIANVENSAAGYGLTYPLFAEYEKMGINMMTSGNHIWDRKEIHSFIDREDRLLRPVNYPRPCPGRGVGRMLVEGLELVVINLMGRVFMRPLDCPFRAIDRELGKLTADPRPRVVLVDFHGEATSEKMAMGQYLDARVGAVVGTHTHVQTADDRILEGGTAYITDVGMTGPQNSVIGMEPRPAIERFLTSRNARLKPASRRLRLNGALIRFDRCTGNARSIERVDEGLESENKQAGG